MPVLVTRKAPKSPAYSKTLVRREAEIMLKSLRIESAELSILLCDDGFIQNLNAEHRGKDRPTDVLSFPLMDPDDEQLATLDGGILGDVVISLDTAARQAQEHSRSLNQEVAHLLAHGLLHLLGYDHTTDAEEEEMNRKTAELLELIE